MVGTLAALGLVLVTIGAGSLTAYAYDQWLPGRLDWPQERWPSCDAVPAAALPGGSTGTRLGFELHHSGRPGSGQACVITSGGGKVAAVAFDLSSEETVRRTWDLPVGEYFLWVEGRGEWQEQGPQGNRSGAHTYEAVAHVDTRECGSRTIVARWTADDGSFGASGDGVHCVDASGHASRMGEGLLGPWGERAARTTGLGGSLGGLAVLGLARLRPLVRRADIADSQARAMLLQIISSTPALHFREIMRRTGLASGQVVHHLRVLEREGNVRSLRVGRRRHFFPSGRPVSEMRRAAVLRDGVLQRACEWLRAEPWLSAQELARRAECSRRHARRILARLRREGLTPSPAAPMASP